MSTIHLSLAEHNASTFVREYTLSGAVPRVGEIVTVPTDAVADMEKHVVALVTDVRYSIEAERLVAHVTAKASHDAPPDRLALLRECGWLEPPAD